MKKPYIYFIFGVLTILIPFGFFILFIYSLSFAVGEVLTKSKDSKDVIYVSSTLNSPDNKFIVTVFNYAGGGAAGWSGRRVNIRRNGESFDDHESVFSVSSGTDIEPEWENNSTLNIKYSTKEPILSLTQRKWNKDKTIKILYYQK